MAEKYGARWIEQYGPTPNRAWSEMLGKYTPHQIAEALTLLAKRPTMQQHPPTEPQFESLLIDSVKHSKSGLSTDEYRRGYWRSTIIGTCEGLFGYAYLPDGFKRFEALVVSHKDTLGASMRRLLDEMDTLEANTGQRTEGMERHCLTSCLRLRETFPNLVLHRDETTAESDHDS